MTRQQWSILKIGDIVKYTGQGYRNGTVCKLTDINIESSEGAKEMTMIEPEAVWYMKDPSTRVFRNRNYRNWILVTSVN